ncbi:MAG: chemotaxis protein CheX [Pirellulaceae bacterium]|nr:chemotaxis protein CheX [Pirellulaceae bacterium]
MSVTIIKESAATAEDFTTPFIESTKSIFSKMLGWEVELGCTKRSSHFRSNHDISGIIGFTGAIRGTIVIGLDEKFAFAAAEAFFGGKPTEIDSEVLDMVGELANMIGGNAKERMTITGVNLGLPTVICGKDHKVSFDPGAQVEILPFTCPFGPLTVEVGIRYR